MYASVEVIRVIQIVQEYKRELFYPFELTIENYAQHKVGFKAVANSMELFNWV